jgi:hypothetical protein
MLKDLSEAKNEARIFKSDDIINFYEDKISK